MTIQTRTLSFPVHALKPRPAAKDWRPQWRFEAEAFAKALGPRQGVTRVEIVITSYSIHYTKLYDTSSSRARAISLKFSFTPSFPRA